MRTFALCTPLAAVALLLAGCPPQVACTTIAIASVNVTVVDGSGAAVPGVQVFYDAGEGEQPCESFGDGAGETSFSCGWEIDGDITVFARAAGFQEGSDTVTVLMTDDLCHVIGESIEIVLLPEAVPG